MAFSSGSVEAGTVYLQPGSGDASSAFLFPGDHQILKAALPSAAGQAPAKDRFDPSHVIAQAAENGRLALDALRGLSFTTEISVEYVGVGDVVEWEYNRSTKVFADRYGAENDRLIEEKSTLPKDEFISVAEVNNLIRIYKFMLTPAVVSQYAFNYVGREHIDELDTLVFDLKPKRPVSGPEDARNRYVRGRIWIDDRDLQVVKVGGEILPEPRPHRTPRFETYFQNYNKLWLPAYATASDDLMVGGDLIRVSVKARFIDYAPNKPF
ncbi:MAG TPA: hypothetical protein VI756_07350 [Blastocatellia bacterium]